MLPRTIEIANKQVFLVDQTKIPYSLEKLEITSIEGMYNAIKTMVVRGAPAIGVSAAAGMALEIEDSKQKTLENFDQFIEHIKERGNYLKSARPTAVNLMWAVDKIIDWCKHLGDVDKISDQIWLYVEQMAKDDESINRAMGKNGAEVIKGNVAVLTHCNAGSLATVYWGTALGVIRELHNQGRLTMAYADETRPRLQGGKITAFELVEDHIPVTVISDNMAAHLMKLGKIDCIVVGADRIAANGDAANKIGTYSVAINAAYHKIPFYVAAPLSTIDANIHHGDDIDIEERDPEELTHINEQRILPEGILTVNPAFDVTPHDLISGIITEKGVISGDYKKEIQNLFH
jgi:methylthioribose-1-phosphate isomerase